MKALFVFLFLLGCEKQSVSYHDGYVKIPAGKYVIGDNENHINKTKSVYLESFSIASHEVTNRQFAQFVTETNYVTTAEDLKNAMTFEVGLEEFEWLEDSTANWKYPFGINKPGIVGKLDHPVTCISFIDALEYCQWSGERLPTLEEWEVACRANSDGKFFWGKDPAAINQYANIWINDSHKEVPKKDSFLFTAPVGSFQPNPWGLYDVYGNVFEFCSNKADFYHDQEYLACSKGGSWWCSENSCNFFNSVNIGRVHKLASFSNQGLRTVKKQAS